MHTEEELTEDTCQRQLIRFPNESSRNYQNMPFATRKWFSIPKPLCTSSVQTAMKLQKKMDLLPCNSWFLERMRTKLFSVTLNSMVYGHTLLLPTHWWISGDSICCHVMSPLVFLLSFLRCVIKLTDIRGKASDLKGSHSWKFVYPQDQLL